MYILFGDKCRACLLQQRKQTRQAIIPVLAVASHVLRLKSRSFEKQTKITRVRFTKPQPVQQSASKRATHRGSALSKRTVPVRPSNNRASSSRIFSPSRAAQQAEKKQAERSVRVCNRGWSTSTKTPAYLCNVLSIIKDEIERDGQTPGKKGIHSERLKAYYSRYSSCSVDSLVELKCSMYLVPLLYALYPTCDTWIWIHSCVSITTTNQKIGTRTTFVQRILLLLLCCYLDMDTRY